MRRVTSCTAVQCAEQVMVDFNKRDPVQIAPRRGSPRLAVTGASPRSEILLPRKLASGGGRRSRFSKTIPEHTGSSHDPIGAGEICLTFSTSFLYYLLFKSCA